MCPSLHPPVPFLAQAHHLSPGCHELQQRLPPAILPTAARISFLTHKPAHSHLIAQMASGRGSLGPCHVDGVNLSSLIAHCPRPPTHTHWALPNPATGGSLRAPLPTSALGLYTHASSNWNAFPSAPLALTHPSRLSPSITSSRKPSSTTSTASTIPHHSIYHTKLHLSVYLTPLNCTFPGARTSSSSTDPQA